MNSTQIEALDMIEKLPTIEFHKLGEVSPPVRVQIVDGACVILSSGAVIEAWRIKDEPENTGIFLQFKNPTGDGRKSLLKFKMTREGAKALHKLLTDKLYK